MSGNTTIVSVGSVTIGTDGTASGKLLDQVNALVNSGAPVTVLDVAHTPPEYTAPTPAPNTSAIFVVPTGYTGTITIPDGYAAVVLAAGSTVTLVSNDPTLEVVSAGELHFTGTALSVAALGDNSTVEDTSDGASVAVGGANINVTLGGANQTLTADNGSSGTYRETGAGDTIVIGSTSSVAAAARFARAAVAVPPTIVQATSGSLVSLLDANAASIVVLHGSANTVSAVAGTNTVFASTGGDIYFGGAAESFFVGSYGSVVAVSTIFGGSGNETVFAETGVNYTQGSGNNIYIGGNIAYLAGADSVASPTAFSSTITATTGHDTLFGGTVGDFYNLGSGNEEFVGGGGSDTLFGGTIAPTVFGSDNENLKLIATTNAILVANGDNGVIDASGAKQGNLFYTVNLPSVLNTTLVGSLAAPTADNHDKFLVASVAGGGTGAAHTITIENFQTGDAFFLSGYTAADQTLFQAAVDTHPTQGGGLSFTLSDNTTIKFVNNHPTTAFDGGKDAL